MPLNGITLKYILEAIMDNFNKVMWVIYWAMFIVVSVTTALYCTVGKVRTWLNRHVVMPYVLGCNRVAEEVSNMYYDYETESEEK